MMTVVCPSVCLSVTCLTLSREQKGIASWKWQEGSPWYGWPVTHLEVQSSKVKVTRLINAETENQPYLRNIRTLSVLGNFGISVYRHKDKVTKCDFFFAIHSYLIAGPLWKHRCTAGFCWGYITHTVAAKFRDCELSKCAESTPYDKRSLQKEKHVSVSTLCPRSVDAVAISKEW